MDESSDSGIMIGQEDNTKSIGGLVKTLEWVMREFFALA